MLFRSSWVIQNPATSRALTFSSSGIERLRIDGAGNVGIGLSSPTAMLQVTGIVKFGAGAASNGALLMVNTLAATAAGIQLFQDNNESWVIQNPATSRALTFSNSGIERLRIDGGGLVGIGKTAPAKQLDVAGGAMTTPAPSAFSATPTFDANASNLIIVGNLTANVTSMAISNGVEGQFVSIRVRQNATGGWTVALPAGAAVAGAVNLAANKTSYLNLTYNATDARWEGNWSQIP